MTKLLTSTAVGLIAAFAVQAQAQDSSSQSAQMNDPCTAQWTAVDGNSDGTISESEAQSAMDAQFSEIDNDGNGMISVKEWKDCTAPSAIPGGFQSAEGTGTERALSEAGTAESGQQGTSGQAQASNNAGQQDTSGQTQASSDAGQQDTSGQAQSSNNAGQQDTSGQTQASSDAGQQDTSEQAQASGDASQQGTESTRALQAPQTGETPADWSDEQFGEMDTDHSGYVTSDEAGEWTRNRITGTMDDEESIGRYGAMFSMMDEDADGRVTQEEWQSRDQMDFEGRFGRVDQDGDGQVSQDEWRDYREQRFGQARQDMQQQGQQDTQQQAQQDAQQQGQDQQQAQADAGEEPTIWLYYFRSL